MKKRRNDGKEGIVGRKGKNNIRMGRKEKKIKLYIFTQYFNARVQKLLLTCQGS